MRLPGLGNKNMPDFHPGPLPGALFENDYSLVKRRGILHFPKSVNNPVQFT
jgi:hypothetical protein